MTLLRLSALSALLLAIAPFDARAQVVATSFEELQPLLKPGDPIDITETGGRKIKGRLGELSASSLELQAREGGTRFSEGDVRQIRLARRDSLWNGTLIGFAPGAAIGALMLFFGAGCDCYTIESRAPFALTTMAVAGGIGAGIGAAIDASIVRRTTVFAAADVNNVAIERSDPLWNGPLIGLATGAGAGLFIELAGRTAYEKFSGAGAIGLGAIGALTGLLIDVLNTDRVIVDIRPAGARSRGATVRLSLGF